MLKKLGIILFTGLICTTLSQADVKKRDHRKKDRTIPRKLVRADIKIAMDMCNKASFDSSKRACLEEATKQLKLAVDQRILVFKACDKILSDNSAAQCFIEGLSKSNQTKVVKRINKSCSSPSFDSEKRKCFVTALGNSRNLKNRPKAYRRGLRVMESGCKQISSDRGAVACLNTGLKTLVDYPNVFVEIQDMCMQPSFDNSKRACFKAAIKRSKSRTLGDISQMCEAISSDRDSVECYTNGMSDLTKNAHKYVDIQFVNEPKEEKKRKKKIEIAI